MAQAVGPSKPELSAEERAQKQADKVFTFIKLQSVRPAPKRVEPPSPPAQAVNSAQVKATAKPQTKVAAAVIAAAAEASPSTAAARDSQRSDPPATLLAAASLTAAAARPELLPPALSRQPEPEPELPALQLLSKVEPEIPRQLQGDFRGGAVTVRFRVQTDGSVVQARVMQSSHKRLSAAAITAVKQWRFAPLSAPREAMVDIAFEVE